MERNIASVKWHIVRRSASIPSTTAGCDQLWPPPYRQL